MIDFVEGDIDLGGERLLGVQGDTVSALLNHEYPIYVGDTFAIYRPEDRARTSRRAAWKKIGFAVVQQNVDVSRHRLLVLQSREALESGDLLKMEEK